MDRVSGWLPYLPTLRIYPFLNKIRMPGFEIIARIVISACTSARQMPFIRRQKLTSILARNLSITPNARYHFQMIMVAHCVLSIARSVMWTMKNYKSNKS